jgi:glucokinase
VWNLAKKSQKKNYKKTLAFDLGGTKIAAAVVDERGKIIEETRAPVNVSGGYATLVQQMTDMALPYIKKYKLKSGAVASAGPLDPIRGTLLNPTNLKSDGKGWGVVPIIRLLEKKMKIKLKLENDAAVAALAEHWVGAGKNIQNLLIVTLGTGLGVGVIANGELIRSGRHLHPEAGHIIIDYNDKEWLCGCGNFGCAEAFLSGTNFTKHIAQKIKRDSKLTGEKMVSLARQNDTEILAEFKKYGDRLAIFLYSLIVMFSPERVVLSGGFSHAADLFIKSCEERLSRLLASRKEGLDLNPVIKISTFGDEAGLLGAAYTVFHTNLY